MSGLTAAYVLHAKPYRETSAIVDLFTPDGRSRAVLRGARGSKGSAARPFQPLEIELAGRSELKTLRRAESTAPAHWLQGDYLFSGLYLNELLVRLLPLEEPHPPLFADYQLTLSALACSQSLEPLLRGFEWRLLDELGYGFSLDCDAAGHALEPSAFYRFNQDHGLELACEVFAPGLLLGRDLQALSRAEWHTPGVLTTAKRLMRQALAPHLGSRPLLSRELFRTR
ncbi:DNA repair protein RecO [Atopomonas sediminilitoris]|uniref:DNA repair protein RecO n=1 Tax=Atopomonas sediminilitoris TaxID=2919919 RepID=UPI001F4D3C1A|nr:DNA repair protein RecO [Atopomonas sediminilitoris]MCJ8168589.1 DNA repair protein RecO [Atopomonas sediminilitoris]